MTWNIHHRNLTPHYYDAPEQQLNEDTQVQDSTLINEYLQGYFGDSLTEDVSGDDIIEAFADLLETARAVEEYCINEGLVSSVLATGKKVGANVRQAGRTATNFAKRHTRTKPLRDISSRTPERQQARDQAAGVARKVRSDMQKREGPGGNNPFHHGSREKETQKVKSNLDSASKRHGGQVGRVLSKAKGRVHRSDHTMSQRDAAFDKKYGG